ncbi:MAG TPA: hypothetical protein PKD12_00810 [Nitrospira sp.]|nr:hypothetical protein [Nitrospira sp.]
MKLSSWMAISFSAMFLSIVTGSPYGFADEGAAHGSKSTHMHVSGVISKIESGLTTIKTPWGRMTIASTATPKDLAVGDDVDMQVNENNTVIDVHRKGQKGHAHRYVTGNLVYASPDKKEVKLWTPEGEKSFDVQAGQSQLSIFQEGAPITVEVNEAGKVIDVHKFTVEMAFADNPRTRPGYGIQAHGVVEKIQSSLIFIKTPTGRYTVPATVAPSDAAVGDEVSLWINEEGLVIDHHGEKRQAGMHRLIFGKLVYAGKGKKQIKLQTPEGERMFPLDRLEVKTKPIPEGSNIVVELNEDGTVIDLRKAQ